MGGSIHVWGGITRHNRTRLVVFNRNVNTNVYVNEVLANIVVPFYIGNRIHVGQFPRRKQYSATG